MLKSLRTKIVRILLATAVAAIFIGAPTASPAHAADCATSASDNCGG